MRNRVVAHGLTSNDLRHLGSALRTTYAVPEADDFSLLIEAIDEADRACADEPEAVCRVVPPHGLFRDS